MKKIIFVLFLFGKCFAQEDSSGLLKADTAALMASYRQAIDEIRGLISAGGLTEEQANLLYQPIGTYATVTQLNLKAPIASPTFTGTVAGITKVMVGLSNVDNTSDASKPVSTAQQTALDLKANQTSISNIDNTSDLSKPISTATQTALNLKADKTNLTTTGSLGYATGAGGTVTQATSKTTGVTINKTAGQITMNGAALTAGSEVAFTVTNSTVAATDVVIVNIQSVGTAGSYLVSVSSVSNGSFSITVSNVSAASLSQAIVLNFSILKSVNN